MNAEFEKGKKAHNVAPFPNTHNVNELGQLIRDVFDVTYYIKLGFLNRLFNPRDYPLIDGAADNTNQFFNAMVALEHIARYITAEVNIVGSTTMETSGPRFIKPSNAYQKPEDVKNLFKKALAELNKAANKIPDSKGFARKFRYDQLIEFLDKAVKEYDQYDSETDYEKKDSTLLGSFYCPVFDLNDSNNSD